MLFSSSLVLSDCVRFRYKGKFWIFSASAKRKLLSGAPQGMSFTLWPYYHSSSLSVVSSIKVSLLRRCMSYISCFYYIIVLSAPKFRSFRLEWTRK